MLPSIDEPPATDCPVCNEALRFWQPKMCFACGWQEGDGNVMRVVCAGCGADLGTVPCVREQVGAVSSGTCPACVRRALCA